MIASLRKLFLLFSARARRNSLILLVMMLFGACLEVVGVAVIPAFVAAIVRPEIFSSVTNFIGLPNLLDGVDRIELVIYGSLLVVCAFACKTGFLVLNFYLQVRFITNRRIELSRRLTRAYMRAPYTFHLERNTSELLRNVDRETSVISYSVIGALLEICTRIIILIGVLAFLFYAEPWITLFWAALFGVLAIAGYTLVSKRLRHHGLAEQRARKKLVQALHQGFGTIKEARVLNREQYFEDGIAAGVKSIVVADRFKLFSGKVIAPVTEFFAVAGLLGIAAALVLAGRPVESVLVTLSLFVVGLVRLRETVNAALLHLSSLRYNLVSVEPVYDDLRALETDDAGGTTERPAQSRPPFLRDRIEVRDVSHQYAGKDEFALSGINLQIPAGSAVGLIGSTGAGKSTLMDIILGLHDPARGGVYVDGRNIAEMRSAWQTRIGYVPQSIYLLDDTIRRNIALGVPDEEIDEIALRRAAGKAQLEPFLARQTHGYDTEVGEHGVRISGGERQRIGIARALYHDPEVLVFDEATSALDNETERAVIAAIEASKGERTIIMIAHRLSTVRNCNTLYYLKAGAIEASGTYEELRSRSGELQIMAV